MDITSGTLLKKKKVYIVLSVILALFFCTIASIGTSNEIPEAYDYNFNIVFTGEKCDLSSNNSVWIKYIIINGEKINASDYAPASGWNEYAGYLHGYGIKDDKSIVELSINNVKEASIVFGSDNASGIVEVNSMNGTYKDKLDLYGNGDIIYNLIHVREFHKTSWTRILLIFIHYILASLLLYFLISWNKKALIAIPICLYYMLFVQAPFFHFGLPTHVLLCTLSIISGTLCYFSLYSSKMQKYKTRGGIIGLTLISVYCSFAFACDPVLFTGYDVSFSIFSISYMLLLIPLMCCFVIAVLYVLENISFLVHVANNKNHFISIFSVMFAVFIVSIFVFYPGNVTVDNLNLIREARAGIRTIPHPVYYYWFVSLLDRIDSSQVLCTVIQCCFFCAISSMFFNYLCKKGLSYRWAIVFAFMFAIHPGNSIGQVTLVKDYMNATAILWLVYLLVRFVEEKDNFWCIKNTIQLFFAISIVMYFRPNGAPAGYIAIILIAILTIRYYVHRIRPFINVAIIASAVVLLGVITPLITPPGPVNSSTSLEFQVKLLIAENYSGINNSGGKLSESTTRYLEKFLSEEEWTNWYLPHNAQPLPDSKQTEFIANIDLNMMIKVYFESLLKSPIITLKNRLEKTNILWDITPVLDSNVFFHVYIYDNEFGIQHTDNRFYQFAVNRLLTGDSYRFITNILMSCPIMLVLLLIIVFFLKMNRKFGYALCVIPLAINVLVLFAGCLWQDYRYYYFLLPATCFISLSSIVFCNKKVE